MKNLKVGNFHFDWGSRTYIMGILNLTPDSFSGDGLADFDQVAPLRLARDFVRSGVDILDIGGESTRPGAAQVSAQEEMDRVLPLISLLASEFESVISIDTSKAEVAEAAIKEGADIVNDVWGLRADPMLGKIAAAAGVPVILMHNRSNPSNAAVKEQLGGRYIGVEYDNLVEDVKS